MMFVVNQNQNDMKLIAPVLFIVISITNYAQVVSKPTSEVWKPSNLNAQDLGEYVDIPEDATIMRLELPEMFEIPAIVEQAVIPVPLPSGKTPMFELTESSVMHPALQAKFPNIRTFIGVDRNDPSSTLRLVAAPGRFHALIYSSEGAVTIDRIESTDLYAIYKGSSENMEEFVCETDHDHSVVPRIELGSRGAPQDVGHELKTYRFALSICGEVVADEGGFANGMLRAVELTSDLNLLYEREFSVHLELIANNDELIFPDPATDPYSAVSLSTYLAESMVVIDSIIGDANYDLGHTINHTTGGVAYVGVTCVSSWKGGGTSPNNKEVLAHEVGHQMSAWHSFNSCNGTSSDPGAWEPGSGNTIMSYFGSCGYTNMPGDELYQYHTFNYGQIHDWIHLYQGNTCPVITSTGNTAPQVNVPPSGLTIPINTPFELEGTVTDDGALSSLTYRWEQNDQGSVRSAPQFPEGSAPIFRSLESDTDAIRTFPALNKVVNGTSDIGEVLPTYSRDLNFRLMALDNNPGAGGVSYDSVKIHVEETAGPFKVLYPNSGSELWTPGQIRTIEWDVSNTDLPPVNCANVDILISYDGGYTYPETLAVAAPNDGQQDVVVPNNPSTDVRIKVRGSDNFFFDISNHDLEIVPANTWDFAFTLISEDAATCSNSFKSFELDVFPLGIFSSDLDLHLTGLPSGVTSSLPSSTNPLATIDFVVGNLSALAPGVYPFQFTATEQGGTITHSQQLQIEVLGHAVPLTGNALSCDGNQRIYVDHHPKFQFGEHQSFTAECWFKTTSASADMALMGPKDWWFGHLPGWVIAMQNGQLVFNVADGDLRLDISTVPTTYNDGEWHHVAANMDRSGQTDVIRLYVDGHLMAENTNGQIGSIDVSGAVDFGVGMDGRWHFEFEGELEELRVWGESRTPTEIRESMHLIVDECDNSLIANFQFNETSGDLTDPVSQMEALVVTPGAMVQSTCPVGPGISDSQEEELGPVSFIGAEFMADYWAHGDANSTTSRIEHTPFGYSGISQSETVLDSQYWVKNRFEENGVFLADLTFSGITVGSSQEINASAFSLYGRAFNSDGDWNWIANATQANSSNGSVTFSNIDEEGQYLLTETEIITGSDGAQSSNEVSVSYGLDGQILVNLGGLDNASINVYSTNGQLVYQASNSGTSQFPISLNEAPGVYMLEVYVGDNRSQHKLVLRN